MTQATFLWPYLADLLVSESYNGRTEFDDLTFMSGALGSIFPGRPYEGGRSTGAFYYKITHDDIIAAGDVQDQEMLIALPYLPIAAGSGTKFAMRMPASSTTIGHTGGETTMLISRSQIEVYARNTANNNSFGQGSIDISALGEADFPRIVRFKVSGVGASTLLQVRHWHINEPEPTSWGINTTVGQTQNNTGIPAIFHDTSSFAAAMSHFSIGTGADAAPAIYGYIEGAVFEAPSTGVSRTVRAVAREDPRLVFETESETDGSYYLGVLLGYTYTVFALDEDSGTFNSPIKDKITPVNPDL